MAENFIQDIADVQSITILPTILDVISQTTGLGFVAVARVTSDKWLTCGVLDNLNFGLNPGDELVVESTICHEVRQADKLVVIDHVDEDKLYCNHHTPIQYGFQSYISVPITTKNSTFFGTLCALDPAPNKLNNSKVIGLFTTYAELISFHLDAIEELRLKDIELKNKNFQLQSFDFVSSHDLQEPLRKIQLFISVINERGGNNLSKEIKKHFTSIENEAQRMRNILKDLLVFSEFKDANGQFENVNLNMVIENTRKRLLNSFSECQGQISVGDLPTVPIISHQIEQLFYNLFTNSISFKSDGCELVIDVSGKVANGSEFENKDLNSEQSYCEITVSDNGKGFDSKYNEKIFGMFKRLDSTERYKSTGIGLTIARRITENHKGYIVANSNINEGATFKIYLPMQQ